MPQPAKQLRLSSPTPGSETNLYPPRGPPATSKRAQRQACYGQARKDVRRVSEQIKLREPNKPGQESLYGP